MPRKVTAYACAYRCGAKVRTSRRAIEEHERCRCLRNPERRACATCRHDSWDQLPDCRHGETLWMRVRCCDVGAKPTDRVCITGCPEWEPEEETSDG